jgi:hypothetical protein
MGNLGYGEIRREEGSYEKYMAAQGHLDILVLGSSSSSHYKLLSRKDLLFIDQHKPTERKHTPNQ